MSRASTTHSKRRRKTKAELVEELETLERRLEVIEDIQSHYEAFENVIPGGEEAFRKAFDHAPVGMALSDPDSRFLVVNKSLCEMLGYSERELLGKTYREITHPDDLEENIRLEQGLLSGVIEKFEFKKRYIQKDGQPIWIVVNVSLVRDADGIPLYNIGHIQDITDRKRAEEALRESEDRFKAVFDNSPVSITLKGLDGRYLLVNATFLKRFGLEQQDVLGRTVHDLVPDSYAELQADLDRRVLDEKATIDKEVRPVYPDGSAREVLIIKFPVLGVAGEPVAIGTITTDITERKRAEEALKESEALLRAFLEFSPSSVTITDSQGRYTLFNRPEVYGAESFHEYALGKTAYDIFSKEIADLITASDKRVLETGQVVEREYEWEKSDGVHTLLRVKFPIRNSEGEVEAIGTITTDITDRKQAEEELRIAIKVAEDANQAKSQFLSSMSHELRTPLNAVLGFGQLLQHLPKSPLTGQQSGYVDNILDGGEHLLYLINEVLDLSKIEAGHAMISIEDVDMADIIKECLVFIEPLAEKHGIRVIAEGLDKRTPFMRADYTRLKQVLLNLLSNAVKYNRSGGTATLECAKGGRGMVRIRVIDSGPGIPPDKQAELFQPFSRLGAEVTGIEGTGIGLTLTKRLVELMGGGVSASRARRERAVPSGSRCPGQKGYASRRTRKDPLRRLERDSVSKSARKAGPYSTWRTIRPTCVSWRKS